MLDSLYSEKQFFRLEDRMGVTFKNKKHLIQALVHRSYLNENKQFPVAHNERLEFLGDAVLELVVTEYLYKHYSNPEGELTNWRASLVNSTMLATLAKEIELESYLFLSRGESKDMGKARQYILANAFEALIGSLYIDHGYRACKKFIEKNLLSKLSHILENKLYMDAKSKFQEIAQEKFGITPTYRVIEETGPDHARHFVIGVSIGEELIAQGTGSSKQEAQMNAAEAGLAKKGWNDVPAA
ncbi:MAG: ribonuclease III [Parcubacteria group bacterium]|nr:ribonuclease III [Parcubacteria group bacterium]